MTPATATARRAAAAPARRPQPPRPEERRAPLRVVERTPGARRGRRVGRATAIAASVIVILSLLMVVIGHALLAQGQLRLTTVQQQLAAEQTLHRQRVLAVAGLETPSRITTQAQERLHMVQPTTVNQLPSVPLNKPLATPKVLAKPTPTTTTPTTTTPSTTTPSTTTPSRTTPTTAPAGASSSTGSAG